MEELDGKATVTSDDSGQFRVGHRVTGVMRLRLLWQLLTVIAVAVVGRLISAAVDSPWSKLLIGLATGVLSVVVYGWVVRRTERRAPVEVAVRGAAPSLAWSAALGVGLFAAVIASIAFLGGDYTVRGLGAPAAAVGLLGFMAGAAVTEELVFRGILFRILEERTGTWLALVLVGLLFGLLHLANPNASLWGAIAIAIEAGGMLTAAYVVTRKLWVPIGLHFGWNVAASAIFSTEVSGSNTPQGLLDATISGPGLVTGGAFGPEASIYAAVLGVLATGAFMRLAHRRGHVIPLRRSARTNAA